jgi:hypothetical protein
MGKTESGFTDRAFSHISIALSRSPDAAWTSPRVVRVTRLSGSNSADFERASMDLSSLLVM